MFFKFKVYFITQHNTKISEGVLELLGSFFPTEWILVLTVYQS